MQSWNYSPYINKRDVHRHVSTWIVAKGKFPKMFQIHFKTMSYLTCLLPFIARIRTFISQSAVSKGLPEELSSRGANLDEPAGQALALNHGGHSGQTVPLYQAAGHACGSTALPGRDDNAQAVVPTAAHGSTSGVHHEADQEAGGAQDVLASEYIFPSILPVLRVRTPKNKVLLWWCFAKEKHSRTAKGVV